MGVAACACHGSRFDGVGRRSRRFGTVARAPPPGARRGRARWVDRALSACSTVETRVPVFDGDGGAFDGPRDAAADVARDRPDIDPCTLGVDVGAAFTAFAAGSWTLLRDNNLIVGRDAMGLFRVLGAVPAPGCTVRQPDATGAATRARVTTRASTATGACSRAPLHG